MIGFCNRHSSPVTRHRTARRNFAALVLCLALSGCGMISWSISNSGDACPQRSTVPCP
jgi:hypothetical protein